MSSGGRWYEPEPETPHVLVVASVFPEDVPEQWDVRNCELEPIGLFESADAADHYAKGLQHSQPEELKGSQHFFILPLRRRGA